MVFFFTFFISLKNYKFGSVKTCQMLVFTPESIKAVDARKCSCNRNFGKTQTLGSDRTSQLCIFCFLFVNKETTDGNEVRIKKNFTDAGIRGRATGDDSLFYYLFT